VASALEHDFFTSKQRRSSREPRIEVGPKQCLANGVLMNLPDSATRLVTECILELLFEGARNGVGEGTKAKGMLVFIGSPDDFENLGYVDEQKKIFENKEIPVQKWKEFKAMILPCFVKDGALFIDGQTGFIKADGFVIDIPTRNADKGGGTGHRNASAVGATGCLAIKCSEDSCMNDVAFIFSILHERIVKKQISLGVRLCVSYSCS